MIRYFVMIIALILTVDIMAQEAISMDDVKEGLMMRARAEWPGDYQMQEYTYKAQLEAVDKVLNFVGENTDDDDMMAIVVRALSEWSDTEKVPEMKDAIFFANFDWQMVWHTIETQVSSYRRINKE